MKITVNGVVYYSWLNLLDKGYKIPLNIYKTSVMKKKVASFAHTNNLDCRRDENGDYHLTTKTKEGENHDS